uniref:G protein beta subunit Gib2 n=1 Tax=Ganoderma boninense TaxID=34458 RepID=A0A5K1K0F3_9APHY|nr:G protein beta subunit Gib2 [Ganoderma boninense]
MMYQYHNSSWKTGCVHGMGWAGKKVFERGFGNKDTDVVGEEQNIEVEVLDHLAVPDQAMEDLIEDDGDDRRANDQSPEKWRSVRLACAGLRIAHDIHSFKFTPASSLEGRPSWRVEGILADKVALWKEEERTLEREAEAQRLRGTRWEDDSMGVDEDEGMRVDGESSEDNKGNSEEIWKLKATAAAALDYITAHIRSHSASLKVQTSRGNYLTNLNVRLEEVDFSSSTWERSMDDLILRAALWQDEHWIDRSAMLKVGDSAKDTAGAAKVVLLSFDRMLCLKARSRHFNAAREQQLASILVSGVVSKATAPENALEALLYVIQYVIEFLEFSGWGGQCL